MKKMFEKAKSLVKLFKLSGLKKPEYVSFNEIPNIWTKFNNTEDLWVNVNFPEGENNSACMYLAKKGSIFPPHKHKFGEQIVILNEGGKVEVITELESVILEYPSSYFVPKDISHALIFKEDTKLLLIFKGISDGWSANYDN